jgi:mono/diheme cytochrome c family protein
MSKHIGRARTLAYFLGLVLGLVVVSPVRGVGSGGDPALGLTLAQEWCAKCHAIGLTGGSPLAIAPPFRDLHKRYAVEDLAESLAEGILVGHPTMPQFRFDPDQIDNLIAFLKTLER